VAVGSGWPDTPFRGPHWQPTIPHRRRHPHPAAADFFPPTTTVSTANATPPPSRRRRLLCTRPTREHGQRDPSCIPLSPLASPTPSLPFATPPHLDAICTRLSLSGRACLSSSSSPRTPRRTIASLLPHDLAGHARRSLLSVALPHPPRPRSARAPLAPLGRPPPPPPFPRRTGRPCCFLPSSCRGPSGPVDGVPDS